MRHCRRTHFTCLDLLLEIFHRHIHPEVSVEVDDDGIDTLHRVEDGTQIVVVADLSGPLLTFQAQLLADELVAESLPVVLRISDVMRIVVARRTTKLGCNLAGLQLVQLLRQTIDIHHHLLTQTCGRSGLSVCLGQHWDILPLIGILLKLSDEFLHLWIVHLVECILNAEWHRRIVDILTGQAKMNEFLVIFKVANFVEFLLDEVLHSLHVVIGHLLDVLHTLRISLREVAIDVAQTFEEALVEAL